jgi:hypothetical protein
MIYLASPYTHDDPIIRSSRVEAARQMAELLMFKLKLPVFSPIVYGDALRHEATDFATWRPINDSMIINCTGVMVLEIDGWRGSRGIQHELALATSLDKPIVFVRPLRKGETEPQFT